MPGSGDLTVCVSATDSSRVSAHSLWHLADRFNVDVVLSQPLDDDAGKIDGSGSVSVDTHGAHPDCDVLLPIVSADLALLDRTHHSCCHVLRIGLMLDAAREDDGSIRVVATVSIELGRHR